MRISTRHSLGLLAALVAWGAPAAAAQDALASHPAVQAAVAYLQRDAARHGLSAADVASLVATDAVRSPRTGATSVYLHQAVGGVPVVAGQMTVTLGADGRLVHAAGDLVAGLAARVAPASARVDAPTAAGALAAAVAPQTGLRSRGFVVAEAARAAGAPVTLDDGGIARLPVQARLVWADPTPETTTDALHLAWEAALYLPGAAGDWYGLIDAQTGAVLETADQLAREAVGIPPSARRVDAAPRTATPTGVPFLAALDAGGFTPDGSTPGAVSASYRVYAYPVESPTHASPLPPADARTLVTDPHDTAASPHGWHDTNGAPGAEFTITRGNNVLARLEFAPEPSPDCGPALACDFPIDLTAPPGAYGAAAVANLFYWTNLAHDVLWRYGFDEASGNFQTINYGGIGAGNDALTAKTQQRGADNTAGLFSVPTDGFPPAMTLGVGTNASPAVDAALDNGVVVHEYSHGLTSRLTGGPSGSGCLSNPEQMGEGWSDYVALMLTMRPGDTRARARGVASYFFGRGPDETIRPALYAPDFAVNAYTYGDTNDPALAVPHGIGFVWATVLWDMTWDLIDAYGFDPDVWNAGGSAGNQIALSLVVEALRLQPCRPGFVTGRDAILAADVALYGGTHTTLLWRAFTRRGLGTGASQGSSSSRFDQVENFDPPEAIPPAPVTDLTAAPVNGVIMLAFTATGDDGTVGTASEYNVRYATTPIETDAAFLAATPMAGEPAPQPSGSPERFVLPRLAFGTLYFVALRAIDDSSNPSPLSNVAQVTTLGPPIASVPEGAFSASVAVPGPPATVVIPLRNAGESVMTFEAASTPTIRDAFGYFWTTSRDPDGPAYQWLSPQGAVTVLPRSDNSCALVTLPFPFPFYGSIHTQVTISENGALGFMSCPGDNNQLIPNPPAPNNFIAVLWDDLDARPGSEIRYWNAGGGRFVVDWLNVSSYVRPGNMRFQAVLYADGGILLQYQTIPPNTGTLASIGIEDPSGQEGIGIAFNEPFVSSGLAVLIQSILSDVSPQSGEIAPGGTADVTVTFGTQNVAAGVYPFELPISTNDPSQPTLTVPITLYNGVVADEPPAETFEGTHRLSAAFPNPASSGARLTLAVAEAQTVRVELYDALGRRVALLHDGALGAREAVTLDVPAAGLAAGAYVVRVAGETFADARRLVVAR